MNVGILGTGNIGTDLLIKVQRLNFINKLVFVGRREESKGINIAKNLNINVSSDGIDFFIKNKEYNVVFDCTNANDAKLHSEIFSQQNTYVIDLTPAKIGNFFIPIINPNEINNTKNLNMVTCGGQASIPLINLISKFYQIEYVEVVSQISSKSAGLSTRFNIDNYIETTESAIHHFSNSKKCKTILNVNPAEPCVNMQTSLFLKIDNFTFDDCNKLNHKINSLVSELNTYIPKYSITLPLTHFKDNIFTISVKVEGLGDYLPSYAGNLDIINCAAIKALELLNEKYYHQ